MSTIQHLFSGAGAPTTAPGSLGAHYTDTTTGDQYLAKGTASAADWILQEKGGAAAAAVQAHAEAANPHPQYAAAGAPATAAADAIAALKLEADPLPQYQQKEAGKGLSTNDYTTDEKNKLAGLEGSHFKGLHASLAALQSAVPSGVAGDYADVDTGAGSDVKRYLWDVSDAGWKALGGGTTLTAAQIKAEYESNPDTNAFTTAEKTKLGKLAAVSVYEVAADYTASPGTHNGAIIAGNSSGDITITIAPDGTPAWPYGASFKIARLGTGKVKIVGGAGVTVRKPASKDAEVGERYGTVIVQHHAPNLWVLSYDLADHVLGYQLAFALSESVELRDGATKALLGSYGYWEDTVNDLMYSPDGSKLAVAVGNNLYVFNAQTGAELHTSSYSLGCMAVAWSPDGSKLAVGSGDWPRVTMLNTTTWAAISGAYGYNYGVEDGAVRSLKFSPDGSKLAITGTTGASKFVVANTTSWTAITTAVQGSAVPMEVAWSPDGAILAVTGFEAPFLELYNGNDLTAKLAAPAVLPAGSAGDCSFSPDGTMFAVAHDVSPYVTIYNVSDWSKIANPAQLPVARAGSVAFSPDGLELAVNDTGAGGALLRYKIADWATLPGVTPGWAYWEKFVFSPMF